MKVNACDRCHVLGKFVLAKWALPMVDKITGKVTGELCDEHLKEAQAKFRPGDVAAFRDWLLGKEVAASRPL